MEPIANLIDQAIASIKEGDTRKYLLDAAKLDWTSNEKTIRNDCAILAGQAKGPGGVDLVEKTLKSINGFYRTRHSLKHIEKMSPILFKSVDAAGWWDTRPASILMCRETDMEPLTTFITTTLVRFRKSGLPQAYSLLTKWAHFCFPDSFVIYDAQAASSIQTWSYFTYPLNDIEGNRYLTSETYKPEGYKAFLDFYRLCWQHASQEQRNDLQAAADDLSRVIGAPVDVVDVIDKLLWLASGDPRKLGLL